MGQPGHLRQPDLPPGPHRTLNEALHQLHFYARYPSLTSIRVGLGKIDDPRKRPDPDRETYVPSRTTVYNAFSSDRLPAWDFTNALGYYLAGRVHGVTPEQVHQASTVIDNLCRVAHMAAHRRDEAPSDRAARDDAARDQAVPEEPDPVVRVAARLRARATLALAPAQADLYWWVDARELRRENLVPDFADAVGSNQELLRRALRTIDAALRDDTGRRDDGP
ncbi:hypothetical protein ACIRS1_19470 [Kitasatospora sp. NPDC101176]|uniref:hypothetical protein n=1 Tax=Kitasatospora sp. NPDC101176 TaxID=3364099 RepID=UPI00382A599B